mmetsp:Transcript_4841/g.11827  ORF Transcript_4841/g.11827 Transcript_4841/m.11827 type:complete len:479 (+) Transcript_4841:287-1723(+)
MRSLHEIIHGERQALCEREARHGVRVDAVEADGLAVDRLAEGGGGVEHALPLARLLRGDADVGRAQHVGAVSRGIPRESPLQLGHMLRTQPREERLDERGARLGAVRVARLEGAQRGEVREHRGGQRAEVRLLRVFAQVGVGVVRRGVVGRRGGVPRAVGDCLRVRVVGVVVDAVRLGARVARGAQLARAERDEVRGHPRARGGGAHHADGARPVGVRHEGGESVAVGEQPEGVAVGVRRQPRIVRARVAVALLDEAVGRAPHADGEVEDEGEERRLLQRQVLVPRVRRRCPPDELGDLHASHLGRHLEARAVGSPLARVGAEVEARRPFEPRRSVWTRRAGEADGERALQQRGPQRVGVRRAVAGVERSHCGTAADEADDCLGRQLLGEKQQQLARQQQRDREAAGRRRGAERGAHAVDGRGGAAHHTGVVHHPHRHAPTGEGSAFGVEGGGRRAGREDAGRVGVGEDGEGVEKRGG